MEVKSKKIRRYRRQLQAEGHDTGGRAFLALARLGWRARPALAAATRDPEPQVRYRAAMALGELGDSRAFEILLALLDDPDGDVRYEAAWALGELGDPRAVEPLVAIVRQEPREDGLDDAVARALERLGAPAVGPLLAVLREGKPGARLLAAAVLGGIGDPAAVEPVAEMLEEPDPRTRVAAIEALAEIRDPRCRALLEARQQDPDEGVRGTAAYRLSMLARPWDPWWSSPTRVLTRRRGSSRK